VTIGADHVVESLRRAGVEVCFGLPGVHNLPIWSALRDSPIRLVGVRHEQAAAYAADGYARATGRVGVALVTTGPGAANTLGAVGEAWASGSPVLVIATDIPKALRRPGVYRGVLHECVDQPGMFAPVVKASFAVGRVEDVASAVERALAAALEHPQRPVYLQLPTDLLSAEIADGRPATPEIVRERAVPLEADVQAAAAVLARARRPLVWAGGGAARDGARKAVASLAERLTAPVILTYSARGLLPPDHPCLVDLPPHLPEVGALWDEADAVVVVGSDLDGMTTQNWAMPRPPRLVAINLDPADATKNYDADVVIRAPAADGVAALAELTPPRPGLAAHRERLGALRARVVARLRAEHPAELAFLGSFAAALPPEAIVLADMCIPGYWLAGMHPVRAPRGLQYPMGWGTLGYAFPAALGAACAGERPVVSVSGDGGFLFACGELATVAQERLPLTAVIVDDDGYGMLRFDQHRVDTPAYGVDLTTPDFAALAASFGVETETVDGLGDEFGAALARHVARREPSVLVARAALQPPPTTSPRWYRHGRS
jgi:thiamine pyrophosphate-dependent acetolactate synthase large subunit-like protein